jgi:transcriptional regulator with XRE-family HTH domain
VAKLSGVSRSMVSQIERGESSPTVATLWNLTQALQVDFAGLLEGRARPGVEVTRAAQAPVIDRGGVRIRILSPAEAVGENEVYDLTFAAGGAAGVRAARPGLPRASDGDRGPLAGGFGPRPRIWGRATWPAIRPTGRMRLPPRGGRRAPS